MAGNSLLEACNKAVPCGASQPHPPRSLPQSQPWVELSLVLQGLVPCALFLLFPVKALQVKNPHNGRQLLKVFPSKAFILTKRTLGKYRKINLCITYMDAASLIPNTQ